MLVTAIPLLCLCFNSMKVRLKQSLAPSSKGQLAFQFHEGPIKTLDSVGLDTLVICFNSMKVRLKRP